MMQTEKRRYWREVITKMRRCEPVEALPMVSHKGELFDRIIYQWVEDLQTAASSIDRAIALRGRLGAGEWGMSDPDYTAMCKWVETGLDRLRQWDSESGWYPCRPKEDEIGVLSYIAAQLDWKGMRTLRNNLAHSFAACDPAEVKAILESLLGDLQRLLGLIRICPRIIKRGDPFTFPIFSKETMMRLVEPLDAEEGAEFRIGSVLILINYDEVYVPRIGFSGISTSGSLWTGILYNGAEDLRTALLR